MMKCPSCQDDTLIVHRWDDRVTSRCRVCGWLDTYRLDDRPAERRRPDSAPPPPPRSG